LALALEDREFRQRLDIRGVKETGLFACVAMPHQRRHTINGNVFFSLYIFEYGGVQSHVEIADADNFFEIVFESDSHFSILIVWSRAAAGDMRSASAK
jgi:hypothetical protein